MKKSRWTRRKFLASSATSAATLPFFASPFSLRTSLPAPACTLIQEQEEGPYYVDREILRKEITEGKPGLPLLLRPTLLDVKSCRPIENAALDIWHCDALGVYSGYTAFQPGPWRSWGARRPRSHAPAPSGFPWGPASRVRHGRPAKTPANRQTSLPARCSTH